LLSGSTFAQLSRLFALRFEEYCAIHRAQRARREQGGARVMQTAAVRARSHEFAIAGESFVPRNGCQQFRNARLPFGRVLRVARMKVVVTSSRVRVHEQQALCPCA
jgi:hypothetical protein